MLPVLLYHSDPRQLVQRHVLKRAESGTGFSHSSIFYNLTPNQLCASRVLGEAVLTPKEGSEGHVNPQVRITGGAAEIQRTGDGLPKVKHWGGPALECFEMRIVLSSVIPAMPKAQRTLTDPSAHTLQYTLVDVISYLHQ